MKNAPELFLGLYYVSTFQPLHSMHFDVWEVSKLFCKLCSVQEAGNWEGGSESSGRTGRNLKIVSCIRAAWRFFRLGSIFLLADFVLT